MDKIRNGKIGENTILSEINSFSVKKIYFLNKWNNCALVCLVLICYTLPGEPNISIVCTVVDRESFSVLRTYH
jgi:hypothetical protein